MSLTNVFIAADLNKFRVSKFTLSNKKVSKALHQMAEKGEKEILIAPASFTELSYYCFTISKIETVRKKFRLFYGSYSLYCKYNKFSNLE